MDKPEFDAARSLRITRGGVTWRALLVALLLAVAAAWAYFGFFTHSGD